MYKIFVIYLFVIIKDFSLQGENNFLFVITIFITLNFKPQSIYKFSMLLKEQIMVYFIFLQLYTFVFFFMLWQCQPCLFFKTNCFPCCKNCFCYLMNLNFSTVINGAICTMLLLFKNFKEDLLILIFLLSYFNAVFAVESMLLVLYCWSFFFIFKGF